VLSERSETAACKRLPTKRVLHLLVVLTLVLLSGCAKPLVKLVPVELHCPAVDLEPCQGLPEPTDGTALGIEETLEEWSLEYRVCQAKQKGLAQCIERNNKRTVDGSWCRARWCRQK
jgi:hypothetical protein